jgi:urease accessory protein
MSKCMSELTLIDRDFILKEVAAGWNGFINIVLKERFSKTVMSDLEHEGPLRVQRPFYPEGELCHIYLLHPPGGLVGGDILTLNIKAVSGAKALFTSPGSTKFYRSAGAFSCMSLNLTVEDNASLEWFPQENIFFSGAKSKLNTVINLQNTAKLLAWDITCLGMPVNDDKFTRGDIDNRLEIKRNGKTFLLERLRVNEVKHLTAQSGLRGFSMQGSFFATGCNAEILENVRDYLRSTTLQYPWGATLIEDLLIVRVLGERTEKIQGLLIPLWKLLRPILLNRKAVVPRIWAT